MRTRTVGLRVSPSRSSGSAATTSAGGSTRPARASVVDAALDAGITLFDTAESYGNGESEVFLGRALAGRRDRAVIATKFGWGRGRDDNSIARGARRLRPAARSTGSLRRLGTDYVDLYQYHRPDGVTPIEETLGAHGRARPRGQGALHRLVELLGGAGRGGRRGRARSAASRGSSSAQNEYSLLDREAERELIPACERLGLGLIPYFPLASGLLTGKYRRGEPAARGHAARGGGFDVSDDASGDADRGARGVRAATAASGPARRRDRRPRRAAGRRLGDRRARRRAEQVRANAAAGELGAVGGGARRAARRSEPPRGGTGACWQEMAPRWERGARRCCGDSTRQSASGSSRRLDPQPGQTILDLAAGTGETGFLAAPRARSRAAG